MVASANSTSDRFSHPPTTSSSGGRGDGRPASGAEQQQHPPHTPTSKDSKKSRSSLPAWQYEQADAEEARQHATSASGPASASGTSEVTWQPRTILDSPLVRGESNEFWRGHYAAGKGPAQRQDDSTEQDADSSTVRTTEPAAPAPSQKPAQGISRSSPLEKGTSVRFGDIRFGHVEPDPARHVLGSAAHQSS